MTSLVAYGSDSEGEDDDFFGKPTTEKEETTKNAEKEKEEESEKIAESDEKPTISSFFFSGDDDKAGSSDSDDSEGESVGPKKKRRSGESVTELDKEFTSSIFDNDYAREERMNARMLSRHVDLSDKPSEKERKKSKFTCKNYLKGKCRFGDKCRFSHPVHNRSSDAVNEVSISSEAKFYTTETPEAQVFHSKKFKSSAGQ
ncbi:C3H1-type domain-containing protein [Caenorhabditis elegans]|uniref:C3H1-type domain-containing protein n=1 Tax=Caenorhabditis elegans TaxID=6239 RepID=Q23170_CAEEL|nr:C3H1-type domain-containing protein [Caenorhabditis elegans]CAA98962.1 C3H1-type domain-containing protein [Caenorhabditis elegans]|eukprot:NP_506163.1 CCCH-type zinc finger putative transcription factor [Caenorhabditis elegans]